MALQLKDYQEEALDELRLYLETARKVDDADLAFYQRTHRQYDPIEQLPGLPYVCIRIPTGGGKTLVACHAVPIAAGELLQREHNIVLWLVPTTEIRRQTLEALRDRSHPYRQALDEKLDGKVIVMDIEQAYRVSRSVLEGRTAIILATLASFRIEEMEGRRVYGESDALSAHFEALPDDLKAGLDRWEDGRPVHSLANLLRLHHPIVIVDEAHNARTELSFDTLARFSPSCILEFTATPAKGSNVLYHVSAAALKRAHMIKLPVQLQTESDWQEAIALSVEKQRELNRIAEDERAKTGEYIRPIVLLQAQPRSSTRDTITVETVQEVLRGFGIKKEQIAVEAYGQSNITAWEEENGKRLFDPDCPIVFIITVQQLKEGWDCPFAYVLCSVAEIGSSTAVEQILGRVLRMPKATPKQNNELDRSYAFVSSNRFGETAKQLADALVANGFSRWEAEREISIEQGSMFDDLPLLKPPRKESTPAERGVRISVPKLAVQIESDFEIFDESHLLDGLLTLHDKDASLSSIEFKVRKKEEGYELGVNEEGRIQVRKAKVQFVSTLQDQLALLATRDIKHPYELAVWLDRNIPHRDVSQREAQDFLARMIEHRIERGDSLEDLSRSRYRLREAAAKKINEYRMAARRTVFDRMLFDDPSEALVVIETFNFTFDPNYYPGAMKPYEGYFLPFDKHYYELVGDMNGEEAKCADLIDRLEEIETWVRNIERHPQSQFWLQTATDKFYPDFLALLKDGRVLAVEYKGKDRMALPDTEEKRRLGGLWAAKSEGRCLFALVGIDEYEATLRDIVK